jgi:hypothetical protein
MKGKAWQFFIEKLSIPCQLIALLLVCAACLLLLSGCGPRTWQPIDDNANNWPFYTPITDDFHNADGVLLQVKGGLVEIFECTSTAANVGRDGNGNGILIDRSLLKIDWCNHFIAMYSKPYERVRP